MMLWLLVWGNINAEDPSMPGLEGIKKPPASTRPVNALPLPASAPDKTGDASIAKIPVERPIAGVVLAAKVGATLALPRGVGFAVALEVGYRLPVLRRALGISLEGALSTADLERDSAFGRETVRALIVSPSVFATGHVSLGPGDLRLLVGPSLQWVEAHRVAADGSRRRNALGVGLTAGLGYFFRLPFGALGVEARYQWLFPGGPAAPDLAHALTAFAGYVVTL